MPLFKKIADHEYVANVWFERGDGYVSLETPRGREIFRLDIEAVHEAIEDGFLTTPRLAGFSSRSLNSNSEWQPHLVAYAREMGLIT